MCENPSFTFARYLRDRWLAAVLLAASALGVFAMSQILAVSIEGSLLVSLFVCLMGIAALAWDYIRKRSFWQHLEESASEIEQVDQLRSLMTEPHALEDSIAADALERVLDLSNAELTQAQLDIKEYRDYIELWIHEAKTPIAAAKLTLSHMSGGDADALSNDMERVENQVEQALYYARMSSVAKDYSIRKIKLADPIVEACKRQARFLIMRQAIPRVELDEGLTVYSDALWLTFMIGQILANAAQYDAKNIRFSAHEENAGTSAGRVVLEISDDGCGIAEADMPRIFDRGFTGTNGRRRGNATGMGLYLVAKMSEQLGIRVVVASEESAGTRVMFSFPQNSNLTKP